jgi:hypothetical protein
MRRHILSRPTWRPGGAVVATDSASADADHDNGGRGLPHDTRTQLREGGLDDGVMGCLIVMERHQAEPFIEPSTAVPPNTTTGGRFIVLAGC